MVTLVFQGETETEARAALKAMCAPTPGQLGTVVSGNDILDGVGQLDVNTLVPTAIAPATFYRVTAIRSNCGMSSPASGPLYITGSLIHSDAGSADAGRGVSWFAHYVQ